MVAKNVRLERSKRPIPPEHILLFFAALAFGVIYVFATPPMQVPDEVGHFWHSSAIAEGCFWPRIEDRRAVNDVPIGVRDLVAVTWVTPGEHLNFRSRIRTAAQLRFNTDRVQIRYPLFYSPVAYFPQALACLVGERLHLRPLFLFYLGRLFNLAAAMALIGLAIRVNPDLGSILVTCASMPMTLFLFASFSADALTIALAFLTTALAMISSPWLIVSAFLLGLCKPVYVLIPLLAALMGKRRIAVAAAGSAVAGAAIASLFARMSFGPMRAGSNPEAQLRLVMSDPLRALRMVLTDLVSNGYEYLNQMVGRLGWLDVRLPAVVIALVLAFLVVVALTSGVSLTIGQRVGALGIIMVTVGLIELSQFIIWTRTGSGAVEGVQGRYFIPILPLLLAALGRPGARLRWMRIVTLLVMTLANCAAIVALMNRYWV